MPSIKEKEYSFNYGWTRPTIPWKLSCEHESADLTREAAYKIFTEDNVDLAALNQTSSLLGYGLAIVSFAFLGPLLGCAGLRSKQYRNLVNTGYEEVSIDEFIYWFGGGLTIGYIGLLITSVLVTM